MDSTLFVQKGIFDPCQGKVKHKELVIRGLTTGLHSSFDKAPSWKDFTTPSSGLIQFKALLDGCRINNVLTAHLSLKVDSFAQGKAGIRLSLVGCLLVGVSCKMLTRCSPYIRSLPLAAKLCPPVDTGRRLVSVRHDASTCTFGQLLPPR